MIITISQHKTRLIIKFVGELTADSENNQVTHICGIGINRYKGDIMNLLKNIINTERYNISFEERRRSRQSSYFLTYLVSGKKDVRSTFHISHLPPDTLMYEILKISNSLGYKLASSMQNTKECEHGHSTYTMTKTTMIFQRINH